MKKNYFSDMVIPIVIYEDNTRLRQSLEMLLSDCKEFTVVGAFANCSKVLAQMETLLPQLVIMDIDMPGINGIEAVKIIKSNLPDIKVVMYTVFDDDNRIFECICEGADGYLLKNTSPVKLIQSLLELAEGGTPMSPFVAQKVFQYFRKNSTVKQDFNLTDREKEILEYLVKGNSYKMIAGKCSITMDTVKKHLQNVYH
ncbi:MAG: response regulator transcription factor, partial [Bacteroidetes bacterium]|nr:response regulator transcription factor [Bacteroidota bacterium]